MVQKIKDARGFTLIEMLIVIAIIALLASIVLVGLNTFRSRARDARRIADLRMGQNMLEVFFANNSAYPAGQHDSISLRGLGDGLESFPTDPLWQVGTWDPYAYAGGPSNLSYAMRATLENDNLEARNNMYDGGGFLACNTGASEPFHYCVGL